MLFSWVVGQCACDWAGSVGPSCLSCSVLYPSFSLSDIQLSLNLALFNFSQTCIRVRKNHHSFFLTLPFSPVNHILPFHLLSFVHLLFSLFFLFQKIISPSFSKQRCIVAFVLLGFLGVGWLGHKIIFSSTALPGTSGSLIIRYRNSAGMYYNCRGSLILFCVCTFGFDAF